MMEHYLVVVAESEDGTHYYGSSCEVSSPDEYETCKEPMMALAGGMFQQWKADGADINLDTIQVLTPEEYEALKEKYPERFRAK